MEFLQQLLAQSHYAAWTAILLGLMTAISPCPLATNITAIAYLSRDLGNQGRVFLHGLAYTMGRMVSYTTLALLLMAGASKFHLSMIFQGWGEKVLGPLLIFIGLVMLDFIRFRLPGFTSLTERVSEYGKSSLIRSFLLGSIFALAFCPYSGVLFFGMLIPLAISPEGGLELPFLYALATGIPVVFLAWLLAFSMQRIGQVHQRLKAFEKSFRKIMAGIFLLSGIYLTVVSFL